MFSSTFWKNDTRKKEFEAPNLSEPIKTLRDEL